MKKSDENKKKIIVAVSAFVVLLGVIFVLFIYQGDISGESRNTSLGLSEIFVDEGLRKCVLDSYNVKFSDNKQSLSLNELGQIQKLVCQEKQIQSTKGIENLVGLTYLDLSSNKITVIDLEKLTKLKFLALDDNMLTKINLSYNKELVEINIPYNNLKTIDLSNNINLINLNLLFNEINSINISNNIKLEFVDLSMNKLDSIDVTKNTSLTQLYLSNNNISEINVSNNSKLKTLNILEGNNITRKGVAVGYNKYIKIS